LNRSAHARFVPQLPSCLLWGLGERSRSPAFKQLSSSEPTPSCESVMARPLKNCIDNRQRKAAAITAWLCIARCDSSWSRAGKISGSGNCSVRCVVTGQLEEEALALASMGSRTTPGPCLFSQTHVCVGSLWAVVPTIMKMEGACRVVLQVSFRRENPHHRLTDSSRYKPPFVGRILIFAQRFPAQSFATFPTQATRLQTIAETLDILPMRTVPTDGRDSEKRVLSFITRQAWKCCRVSGDSMPCTARSLLFVGLTLCSAIQSGDKASLPSLSGSKALETSGLSGGKSAGYPTHECEDVDEQNLGAASPKPE
jgi:hypothetical protein